MIACGVCLFWYGYTTNRKTNFMSLNDKAGLCRTSVSSTSCCEIERPVVGTYLVDSDSTYDTSDSFNYQKNLYNLNFIGLSSNTTSWKKMIRSVQVDLLNLANRAQYRDYAWNMVVWASYSYVPRSIATSGVLSFSLSGDIEVMFNKPIVTAGYASNYTGLFVNVTKNGTLSNYTYGCSLPVEASFSSKSRLLNVQQNLQTATSTCIISSTGGYNCPNPCPGILPLQAVGYNPLSAQSSIFTWSVDMASVMSAIAVNYGILKLDFLEKFDDDANRIQFLQTLLREGKITADTYATTSSYFGKFYCFYYLVL
jgi:hypothetical protein